MPKVGAFCLFESRKKEKFRQFHRGSTPGYYLTSVKPDLDILLGIIRSHWGIENILHRSLDVFFKEDACQVRERIGEENLSMLRKLAGSILHRIDPKKTLKSKMKAMLGSNIFRMGFLACDW